MSKELILYTMYGCPHCTDMKELLVQEGIQYTERDCDEYEMQYNILVDKTKNEFVPAFEIKDNENYTKRFIVPDRDFEELTEAVTKIKKYL